jgi:signal transduction histidine kinase
MMEKALVLSCNPEGCDQAQQQPACLVEGIVAYAIIPLQSKARVIGLMDVGSGEERHFTAKDMKFLESVGVQIGVAIENTELWDELKDKEELRGQLLERVITAQEEERKRIARELHDQTGQALTSLLVSLKVIEKAGDLEQARELTSDMRAIVTETLDDVHNLSLELRPSVLDDMGLVPALARYVESCPARFGLQVDFVIAGMDRQRLPMEVETTLYRIAQEALTNVARHSKAGHASVLLERRRRAAVLVIEDDGEGFDTAQVLGSPAERERLGLYGMMERASLVGGQLTVESRPGAGTTVSVEVPLEELWLEDHGVRAG